MVSQYKAKIAIVHDFRLSRERRQIFDRLVYALQGYCDVMNIAVKDDENILLEQLSKNPCHLVLVPWDFYLKWNRVEAFYGLTRNSGPTFAGYIAEPADLTHVECPNSYSRMILFDYTQLPRDEAIKLTVALAHDSKRWGLHPLLEPKTTIFSKVWSATHDEISIFESFKNKFAFLSEASWKKRSLQIQSALLSLHELAFADLAQQKILLQFSATNGSLLIRACINVPNWNSQKNQISTFAPTQDPIAVWKSPQMIRRSCDWFRTHFVVETKQLEIVIGFFESSQFLEKQTRTNTLWIEPLATAIAQEVESDNNPVEWIENQNKSNDSHHPQMEKIALILEQNQSLLKQVKEKDQRIHELLSGGIGQNHSFAPPDTESLLEAIFERYSDLVFQIETLEDEIKTASADIRMQKKIKLDALKKKQLLLVTKVAEILQLGQAARRSA